VSAAVASSACTPCAARSSPSSTSPGCPFPPWCRVAGRGVRVRLAGHGRLFYDALLARDTAVVLALTALTAALVIAGSLLADLAMAALDPRVRLGRPGGTPA
jgi:hypothetical protein